MPRKKKTDPETEIVAQSEIVRTREQSFMALKKKTRNFQDLQRLRLQVAGRTYKRPVDSTIYLHEMDVKVLEQRADRLLLAEKEALQDIEAHLKTIPFYKDVLSDKNKFKGIGPTMAAVILSEYDIFKLDNPSKMWSFAGLAPIDAYRCKTCSHIVEDNGDNTYLHKPVKKRKMAAEGEVIEEVMRCPKTVLTAEDVFASGKAARPEKGKKLAYNAFLRSKLCGVLGPVLLKLNSPWRKVYDDNKRYRQNNNWGVSDAHRHNDSIRKMIKMLLLAIWREWRAYENLPIPGTYHEQKLGHVHSGPTNPCAVKPLAPVLNETDYQQAEIDAELAYFTET